MIILSTILVFLLTISIIVIFHEYGHYIAARMCGIKVLQFSVGFGKKIIYQESPETLPKEIYNEVKREIAKRILSEKKEKWWTCKEFYFECDNLREKYSNENDHSKLKFLDELNEFVMSIQKKYENA